MKARIFSQVVCHAATLAVGTIGILTPAGSALAQGGSGYYTNPDSGIVYRQVTRTIERPVLETKIETREQTVYRPQTVTESKPESRTVFTPVVQYNWEPRLHGRWNPFQQPTVVYHHVPQTTWEARNEVVQRTNTRTEWVAEKRTVDVPQQLVRMERQQQVEYEVVGRVAPQQAGPSGVSEAIASRLRPLDAGARIEPIGPTTPGIVALDNTRIAASSVGRLTSDPPQRSIGQGGLRATELSPMSSGVRGQALPPASNAGVGVAALPTLPFFR